MSISPHASVVALATSVPLISHSAFIAAGARIIGAAAISEKASIWYNAVLRADGGPISVGPRANVQDGVVVHTDEGHPVVIGADVSIGHNAVLHGCVIGDGALIGMGATVLNGSVIGPDCLVAAGAVVLEGTMIAEGSLVAGVPAKVRRPLTDVERQGLRTNASLYLRLASEHALTM